MKLPLSQVNEQLKNFVETCIKEKAEETEKRKKYEWKYLSVNLISPDTQKSGKSQNAQKPKLGVQFSCLMIFNHIQTSKK